MFILFQKIAGTRMPIDERIKSKIRELVSLGVTNVKEMERHLIIYVERELFPSQKWHMKNNRRFYPLRQDIRNHMYMATQQIRYTMSFDITCL